MQDHPYWLQSVRPASYPSIDQDLTVDVVVIGGGITGATAAYLFKREGYKVCLVDRATMGGCDSSRTTAHLSMVTDVRLKELVSRWGVDRAAAVWQGGQAAIGLIERIIRSGTISCEFKTVPAYLVASSASDPEAERADLLEESQVARDLGFSAEMMEQTPIFGRPGVKFVDQAKFHPVKYLTGLVETIPGEGSLVAEHSEVTEICSDPMAVVAAGHRIRCQYIVIATHTPLTGQTNLLSSTLFQSKLFLYNSYAVGARLPAGTACEACFWDTETPYHYLRIDRKGDFDYAILGGGDHKTGQLEHTETVYHELNELLQHWLPSAKVDHRWSGQVIETPDGLPYIGESAPRQFIATGFGGNGMTFGTLAAMMAVDAFHGYTNPWKDLFAPSRKASGEGLWHYLRENADYPYYLMRDWVAGTKCGSLQQVEPGRGMIVNVGKARVAAYRDPSGALTLCSPVCPHLKCLVAWNEAERTWDCPCHGSRFSPTGDVISGPAEKPLERLKG
ncbi:MAG: FAD-dependent oxidoreductase [Verrucomicrobiales bacterium]|nr:FAD-dependent oxidoreductase [Verrucomicrobiales bacterium]